MTHVDIAREHVLTGPILSPIPAAVGSDTTNGATLRRLLVAVDAAAIAVGWLGTLFATGAVHSENATPVAATFAVGVLLAALTVAVLAGQKLYLARVCAIRAVEITRLGRSAAFVGLVALIVPRLLPVEVDMLGAVIGAGATFAALMLGRSLYRSWLQAGRRDGKYVRQIILVGSNDEASELARLVRDHPELGYSIVGYVGDEALAGGGAIPWLGSIDDATVAIAAANVNGVVVATSALESAARNRLIRQLLTAQVHVHVTSGIWGISHQRLRAQPLAHEPMFYVEPLRLARWQFLVKRVIDLTLSIVGGLLIAAPVVLVAALAIKLQDRGPVFYRQRRIGRHGREFEIMKLRTMIPDADKLYFDLAETRAGRDGPLIKLADDPRRTRVGRILERASIDELPQILNVIKGEMSLVGPRPAQASEVAQFDEELMARQEVLPGITGLWQVEARDNPRFSAYRRFDLFYIENWSVGLDLAILLETIQRVAARSIELIVRGKPELAAALPRRTPVES